MKYNKEFKAEALKLSDEIGVQKAAQQLGLPYYTLTDWCKDRKADARSDESRHGNAGQRKTYKA